MLFKHHAVNLMLLNILLASSLEASSKTQKTLESDTLMIW